MRMYTYTCTCTNTKIHRETATKEGHCARRRSTAEGGGMNGETHRQHVQVAIDGITFVLVTDDRLHCPQFSRHLVAKKLEETIPIQHDMPRRSHVIKRRRGRQTLPAPAPSNHHRHHHYNTTRGATSRAQYLDCGEVSRSQIPQHLEFVFVEFGPHADHIFLLLLRKRVLCANPPKGRTLWHGWRRCTGRSSLAAGTGGRG